MKVGIKNPLIVCIFRFDKIAYQKMNSKKFFFPKKYINNHYVNIIKLRLVPNCADNTKDIKIIGQIKLPAEGASNKRMA